MKVIILDFRASLTHTHHAQYIYSHVNFIRNNFSDSVITIFLPVGSAINKKQTNFPNRLFKILIPTEYFALTEVRRPSTWFTYLLSKLNKHLFLKFNKLVQIVNFMTTFATLLTLVPFKKDLILFPSACPRAIKLIEWMNFFRISAAIRIHFPTPHSDVSCTKNFLNEAKRYRNLNIAFSFETDEARTRLMNKEVKQLFFYARQPFLGLPSKNKKSVEKLKSVYILGRPWDKGRDEIVSGILKSISSIDIALRTNLEVFITYNSKDLIKLNLDSLPGDLQIHSIPYNLPFLELANTLLNADIVILPYDPYVYEIRHSGLLFLSSDMRIPIITSTNCSFSTEVQSFNIGRLVEYRLSYSDAVLEILNCPINYGFEEYFLVRNFENRLIYSHLKLNLN